MRIDGKEMGLNLLLGTGVVVLQPILLGILGNFGVDFLNTTIASDISIGGALAAGVSAFLMNLGIDKWLR